VASTATKRTLFLLFMPVVTAEFLTGSTPLPSLLDPLTLPLLLGLYGLGAILVRELTAAWNKGWPTMIALGAAYGVIEEGLDVKSWFNPTWPALGPLAVYGRVFGVNTVWAVELTTFHAVFSITIPIVMTRLLFPERRSTRWFRTRTLEIIALVFVGVVAFGFAFFPYNPPAPQYLVTLAIAASLTWAAHRLPATFSGARTTATISAGRLVGLGFVCSLCFFLIFWAVPVTPVPPLFDLLLMLLLGWSVSRFLVKRQLTDYLVFSLVAGALGPLIVVGILGLDFLEGPPLVAIAYVVALFAMGRRIKVRSDNVPAAAPPDDQKVSAGSDNVHLPSQN
jgi:hypothetical protein